MRYNGCKNKLLNFLNQAVIKTGLGSCAIFCDLFSGATVVAKYFKQKDFIVYANDFLEFSYTLITGNYSAFLKYWDNRTYNSLKLQIPEIIYNQRENRAFKKNAIDLIKKFIGIIKEQEIIDVLFQRGKVEIFKTLYKNSKKQSFVQLIRGER